jgi:exosortase
MRAAPMPRFAPRTILAAAAFAGAGVAAFWPTLGWMAERFEAHDSYYSHGWLIPLASAWLLWQRRDALQHAPRASSWAGLGLLLPALALHIVATWLDVHIASGLALWAALWGLVWTLWGRAVLRIAALPLVFLWFMIPLPGVLLIAASFTMKLWAAAAATQILKLLGLAATQAGSMISVPGITVIVDDVCSGLRSLISLLALAVLWTALMPARHLGQRAVVILAAVPIALVANIVRIVILVLIAAVYGAKAAEGFIHYGSGMVVFLVALAVLAWLTHLLTRKALP